MTVPRDPLDAFADMMRGVAGWLESAGEKVSAMLDDIDTTLATQAEDAPSTKRTCCSTLPLDAALAPGTTVRQTRMTCGMCGRQWAPVFSHDELIGWMLAVVTNPTEADRFLSAPIPGEIAAERARRAAQDTGPAASFRDRSPGTLRWRAGRPHVAVEKEGLLFEQAPDGDRFIGEMINGEFAQWITAARALALDHDFEGGYHAASASADAFRDHIVALLGLDERPSDIELRQLLTEKIYRLNTTARAAAEARNAGS